MQRVQRIISKRCSSGGLKKDETRKQREGKRTEVKVRYRKVKRSKDNKQTQTSYTDIRGVRVCDGGAKRGRKLT